MINKWKKSIKKIPQKDEFELEGIKNWRIHEANMINKWKKSIKKIPQKDEFELEGIKNWRIHHFEMIPNEGIHEQLFREEAVKLLAAGFDLAINAEHGVGSICVTNDGFVIELWQYNKKKVIHKKALDEVLDWIIYFYDH